MANEDDPDVQRNGFDAIAETMQIPEGAMEEFYDEDFNPGDSYEENQDRFFRRFEEINSALQGADESEIEDVGTAVDG